MTDTQPGEVTDVLAAMDPRSSASVLASEAADTRLQPWVQHLRRGHHQTERLDADAVTRARTWNSAVLVTSGTLLAVGFSTLLVLLVLPGSRTGLRLAYGALLVLLGLLLVPRMLRLRRRLRHRPDASVAASADGITLPGGGTLNWHDVAGMVYLDDRQRTARSVTVPFTGWALRLALRAGEGTIFLTVGVRDGARLRHRIGGRDAADLWLYRRDRDGLRPGAFTVPLDVLLSQDARERFVAAVRAGAVLAGVPFHITRGPIDHERRLGRMLDPRWPQP